MPDFTTPKLFDLEEVKRNTLMDWVPLGKMFVAGYGRPLSQLKLNALIKKWDINKCAPLILSYRSETNTYAVLDGWHRRMAALRHGIPELPCRIYIDLTYEQEADYYLAFATVNQQNAADRFRARLESREPVALEIQRIVRGQGLQIGLVRGNHNHVNRYVTAVDALDRSYGTYGAQVLAEGLRILDVSFGGHRRGFMASMIAGICAFLVRYQHDEGYRAARLVDRLQKVGADGWSQRATDLRKGGVVATAGSGTGGPFGQAALYIYNAGLREESKLPNWIERYLPTRTEAHTGAAQRGHDTRRQNNLAARGGE